MLILGNFWAVDEHSMCVCTISFWQNGIWAQPTAVIAWYPEFKQIIKSNSAKPNLYCRCKIRINGLFGKNSRLRCFVANFIADGFTRFLCYFFWAKSALVLIFTLLECLAQRWCCGCLGRWKHVFLGENGLALWEWRYNLAPPIAAKMPPSPSTGEMSNVIFTRPDLKVQQNV